MYNIDGRRKQTTIHRWKLTRTLLADSATVGARGKRSVGCIMFDVLML